MSDSPVSPVVKTPSFQYKGHGLDPWLGGLRSHIHGKKKKQLKIRESTSVSLNGVQKKNREWETAFKEIKGSDFLKTHEL